VKRGSIVIEDNGPGIPAKTIDGVLETDDLQSVFGLNRAQCRIMTTMWWNGPYVPLDFLRHALMLRGLTALYSTSWRRRPTHQ
jgi:hypothetical protein